MTAWDYGIELLNQEDIDTGIALLQRVVTQHPTDLSRRQALRQIEKSIRTEGKVDAETVSLVMSDVWWTIRQARHKQIAELTEWAEIDRAIECGLAVDPWNVDLNVELGDISRARGYWEIARFAYGCALETAPDRTDISEIVNSLPVQSHH